MSLGKSANQSWCHGGSVLPCSVHIGGMAMVTVWRSGQGFAVAAPSLPNTGKYID
jgi:hypothetical protein